MVLGALVIARVWGRTGIVLVVPISGRSWSDWKIAPVASTIDYAVVRILDTLHVVVVLKVATMQPVAAWDSGVALALASLLSVGVRLTAVDAGLAV